MLAAEIPYFPDMKNRPYDIVLFGATGFTGHLISEYLVRHAAMEDLKIALAGRNEAKGSELINAVMNKVPEGKRPGWISADVNDMASLLSMAEQTSIVMNAAGPFAIYGIPVVEASVKSGCHYLDITGEPDYVHEVKIKFDELAKQNHVAVVSACGFDSLPADLGTYVAVSSLKNRNKVNVWSFFRTNARFSGGTWRTAILAIHRRMTGNKSPRPERPPGMRSRRLPIKLHFSKRVGRWALPMPVADPHIVKRSATDMPDIYGPSFAYAQFFTVGSFGKVLRIVLPISLVFLLVRIGPLRNWLLNRNKPGDGPDARARERSKFEVRIFAESEGESREVIFSGGDPGYNETAKMFSESAFCMAEKDREGTLPHGVLSPAHAFGMPLIDRLRQNGIRVEVQE